MSREQKRARLANLVDAAYLAVDDFVDAEIPDIQSRISALAANTSRTNIQDVELRSLRRDLKIMRFMVRLARIVLLVVGKERNKDLSGSDG